MEKLVLLSGCSTVVFFSVAFGDTLTATHFWDCNGAGCDSRTLDPWDERKYAYASQYAPKDPNDHGGASSYGEMLWLTGAASDSLSTLLAPDAGCCGSDPDGGGGCGKCVLVTNPSAVKSEWKAIAMKKNRCPPGIYFFIFFCSAISHIFLNSQRAMGASSAKCIWTLQSLALIIWNFLSPIYAGVQSAIGLRCRKKLRPLAETGTRTARQARSRDATAPRYRQAI